MFEIDVVHLEFKAEEGTEGISISGGMSGGANDSQVVIKANMEQTQDFSKMFGQMQMPGMPKDEESPNMNLLMIMKMNVEAKADLSAKVVDMNLNMHQTIKEEDNTSTFDIEGSVVVSAGDSKYVSQKLTLKTNEGDKPSTQTMDFRAELIDRRITVKGTVDNNGEKGEFGFDIVRTGDTCKVINVVDTM